MAQGVSSEGDEMFPKSFTRMEPTPTPTIVAHTEEFPGGGYAPSHLLDEEGHSHYAASGQHDEIFVEFDFGRPRPIAGFRHVDRNDPATVASSELVFKDAAGNVIATEQVEHVNMPGGTTDHLMRKPVTAQRVRWQVSGLGPHGHKTVGGAAIRFFQHVETETSPEAMSIDALPISVWRRTDAGVRQPVHLTFDYPYAEPIDAVVHVGDAEPVKRPLQFGTANLEVMVQPSESQRSLPIKITVADQTIYQQEVTQQPMRETLVYILPHSHVDIGYTELQTEVLEKQHRNLEKGIELARKTADNPPNSRYVWNAEVLWAVEDYLRTAPEDKKAELIEAIEKGWVVLDALYGNLLTGLCRPEELLRLFDAAEELEQRTGVKVETAMISDVPGYTWGLVTAMHEAGVKYFSIGPNYIARIGHTMRDWQDKPFYWVGPTGDHKILCWIPWQGYAASHLNRDHLSDQYIINYMTRLDKEDYPYDVNYMRWSGFSDNAVPDETVPDFVKAWNEKYAYPQLIIGSTAEAFSALETRHGDELPTYSGDWTPYWEDGAASSADETAMNRESAERLVQAEVLWSLIDAADFPKKKFDEAWRNVMLYSEHTWGAWNSVMEPEAQFVKDQWEIKQAFALDARKQSKQLLTHALEQAKSSLAADSTSGDSTNWFAVVNTNGWTRTDLATIPADQAVDAGQVVDADGEPVVSQRLSSGEIVFVADSVPPFAGKRYGLTQRKGSPATCKKNAVRVDATALDNGLLKVRIDQQTGTIVELRVAGTDRNLVDENSHALNGYFYTLGADTAEKAHRPTESKVTIKEDGPLVGSILVESQAEGCRKLTREIRLVAGRDHLEIINVVDKERIHVPAKPHDWSHARRVSKESVHFGFAFDVPDATVRMDTPWAVVRPNEDQLRGACKNWFTVQRWVDLSNDDFGVTWSTIDAPLVQVGGITANVLGMGYEEKDWLRTIEPSATLFSWAMNNHWFTNYRAYQEGPTTFRYAVRPHDGYCPIEAARFGIAQSQPLIVTQAVDEFPMAPRLRVTPDDVLVTAIKPSDDGQAWIVRLFGAAGNDVQASIKWSEPQPETMWLSDLSEKPLQKLAGEGSATVDVPAWDIVTIRAERPNARMAKFGVAD